MDLNKIIKENAISLVLFLLLFNYGLIHFCVLQTKVAAPALQDYGTIQVLTALFIISCQLISLWNFTQSDNKMERIGAIALVVVLQVYFMREADLHHFFTDKSVAGIRYFKNLEMPLLPKLIAGPILLLFFVCFVYLLIRYSWFTLKAFFRGEPWAVAVGFWGSILVLSQIYDRIDWDDYDRFNPEKGGIEVPWRIKLIEEYMEFMASAYLPLAMVLYIKMKKKLLSGKTKNQE